jgi:hypothetical protein
LLGQEPRTVERAQGNGNPRVMHCFSLSAGAEDFLKQTEKGGRVIV